MTIYTEVFIPVMGPVIVPVVGSPWGGSYLPPDFIDDIVNPSTLLSYWDGANATPTTKTDKINGWNMVAVEGPCLTLAVGDKIYIGGHGTITSNSGTVILAYDGNFITITTGGTLYNLQFSDGLVIPCCEGSGGTVGGTLSGLVYTGDITAALDPWTATQDEYFYPMTDGLWSNTDGVTYPYNRNAIPVVKPEPPELLGPELVVNTDFAGNDISGWSVIGSNVLSSTNEQLISTTTATYATTYTSLSPSPSSPLKFKLTFDFISLTSGKTSFRIGDSPNIDIYPGDVGSLVYYITTVADSNILRFIMSDIAEFIIDNVSVKEVL